LQIGITLPKFIIVAGASAVLSACTFVKLTDGGQNVDVRLNSSVASCERISRVSANVVAEVVKVNRGDKKVAAELETMARNDAAVLGGNVIVPETEIAEGSQSFGVYKCP
jgi:hypothetical protein